MVAGRHKFTRGECRPCATYTAILGRCPISVVGEGDNPILTYIFKILVPRAHRRIRILDYLGISVVHIAHICRNKEGGGHGVGRSVAEYVGRSTAYCAVYLLVSYVADDLREESSHVKVVWHFLKSDRGIVQPSHTLIALRAVGCYAVDVVPLGHYDHILKLVNKRITAPEAAARIYVGIELQTAEKIP